MDMMANKRLRMTMKTLRACFFICLFALAILSTILLSVILVAKWQGPPSVKVNQSTILYANDGAKLGETHHGEKRYWVSLDEMSPAIINATVAVEDRHFFDHHGFDIKRIAGAAFADFKALAMVQGASTITQQYARNLYLDHDKTWKRKLNEAFYTIRLEQNYSKEEILEGYLNTIYYGHGAYGVEAASRFYFDKPAKDLNIEEAAMLAGIPKGPSIYSPYINRDKAIERQQTVLHMMEEQKFISEKEESTLRAQTLSIRQLKDSDMPKKPAPYFYDAVLKELEHTLELSKEEVETGGLHVYTTLDPRMQEIAEQEINRRIDNTSKIQVGFAAMNPGNGHVLALVGGVDYEKSPFNRVTQAKRQPGSTMKPLLYYNAIKHGFSPSTLMKSEATTFTIEPDGKAYSPANYNGYYANGNITLLQALALSDNIFAVKTHLFLGMDQLIQTARQLGIKDELAEVPSLALGTSPIKPIEMINAYGILANGGREITPVFIKKVTDASGNVLYEESNSDRQILDKKAAFVTASMMTGMFDQALNSYTSVTGRAISDQLTRTYAGKSGTTETDSWMIGFYPGLVSGVWTGYDKTYTIDSVAEKSYSKQIWAGFMEKALENEPEAFFKPPAGVSGIYIDPKTGFEAGPGCANKHFTYFVKGTEPTGVCYGNGEMKKKEENVQPAEKENKRPKWWEKWLGAG
ncbi:transglycosylase domain-containing protein [Bacillus gobiensis]|uniref:transglycosylase domain-containing protein n=1 Tax=Bacillus gobiensis TaxID=1441095 RepID=UPI003D206D12